VRGLEFGTTEHDVPYLVMEYAPNGTLRNAHPKGERVPPEQIVDYVMQITSALQYMHGRKLMHLDLKPENVLRGAEGQLLLSDFGLVRVAHSTASQSSIDRGGGTIPYMDPELLRGGRASKRSDQRSLAVMVCEWLSGKHDRELGNIIYQWLGNGRCPQELRDVPEKVREVLFRALAQNPKDRFSSVGMFTGVFVGACAEQGVPIGEHLLPMMDELRKNVEKEATNAQGRVNDLDHEMHELKQENENLKRNLESNEKIQKNLRERVGELERQGQVYQQGSLEQENRILQEKIDELNYKMQTIEEEKKNLKNEIEENRNFYDDNMKHMYESMVDHYRDVIQENQDKEKIIQEMAHLLNQARQQEDHVASTSSTSSLERGEASSSSTERERVNHNAEQQLNEEQNVVDQVQNMDQENKGKEKKGEEKASTSGTPSLQEGDASSSSAGQEGISHNDKLKNMKLEKSGNSYFKSMYRSPGRFYTYTALINIFGAGFLGNMLAKSAYKKNIESIESKLNEVSFENAEEIRKMIKRVGRYEWTVKSPIGDFSRSVKNALGFGILGNLLAESADRREIERELLQRLNKALQEKDHEASTSGTPSHERGGASSSSTGREGTNRYAEQQRPDHIDQQASAGGESGAE
jgi:serine/threonine protein kinase